MQMWSDKARSVPSGTQRSDDVGARPAPGLSGVDAVFHKSAFRRRIRGWAGRLARSIAACAVLIGSGVVAPEAVADYAGQCQSCHTTLANVLSDSRHSFNAADAVSVINRATVVVPQMNSLSGNANLGSIATEIGNQIGSTTQ